MSKVKLVEGKTKIVWDNGNGTVLIESKDDITAGDGARKDVIGGKAKLANATTVNCFELLDQNQISTHYMGLPADRTFEACKVKMIPLELVARRIATGSYLKRRPDVAEGTVFDEVIIEFFEKDDANHDPLVVLDIASLRLLRFRPDKPLEAGYVGEQSLRESALCDLDRHDIAVLADITESVFMVLEKAWSLLGVTLVDLKIECGWNENNGELVVADVIDNDSWRIWPQGDKTLMKDKQVYRDIADAIDPAAKAKELGTIKRNYEWVAEQTGRFLLSERPSMFSS